MSNHATPEEEHLAKIKSTRGEAGSRMCEFARSCERIGIVLTKEEGQKHLMFKVPPPTGRDDLWPLACLGMLDDGSLYAASYVRRIGTGNLIKSGERPPKDETPWKLDDRVWESFLGGLSEIHPGFAHEGGVRPPQAAGGGKHVRAEELGADQYRQLVDLVSQLLRQTRA